MSAPFPVHTPLPKPPVDESNRGPEIPNPEQLVPPADTSGLFLFSGSAALHVLHAEDDQQIADIVAFYFEQHGGATITHVSSGKACLEAMKLVVSTWCSSIS